jgi:hypothetical protein
MTIVGYDTGNLNIIGYINTSYSSLSVVNGARRYGVYNLINSDISAYVDAAKPRVNTFAVNFSFDQLATDPTTQFQVLPNVQLAQCTTVRYGQATDSFNVNYQSYKSRNYQYWVGIGSATYPRARFNLTNVGNVNSLFTLTQIAGANVISADEMYIWSPTAEARGRTLNLQILYYSRTVLSVATTYYSLDI